MTHDTPTPTQPAPMRVSNDALVDHAAPRTSAGFRYALAVCALLAIGALGSLRYGPALAHARSMAEVAEHFPRYPHARIVLGEGVTRAHADELNAALDAVGFYTDQANVWETWFLQLDRHPVLGVSVGIDTRHDGWTEGGEPRSFEELARRLEAHGYPLLNLSSHGSARHDGVVVHWNEFERAVQATEPAALRAHPER